MSDHVAHFVYIDHTANVDTQRGIDTDNIQTGGHVVTCRNTGAQCPVLVVSSAHYYPDRPNMPPSTTSECDHRDRYLLETIETIEAVMVNAELSRFEDDPDEDATSTWNKNKCKFYQMVSIVNNPSFIENCKKRYMEEIARLKAKK